MPASSKVVWSEGLFLRPQHFQQQDRYHEQYVEQRCGSLVPHSWGVTELTVARGRLQGGVFELTRATGVFPDGTPLSMPDADPLPAPLAIGPDVRDQVIVLAVPVRGGAVVEISDGAESLARHGVVVEDGVRDAATSGGEPASLQLGALRTRLLLARDVDAAYACIPVGKVVEVRGGAVVLDEAFIPTVLQALASTRLTEFIREAGDLLHQRGDALAGRTGATDQATQAGYTNLLMLSVINRYEPVVRHWASVPAVHPEQVFRLFATAVGELATFTQVSKRPPQLPEYRHAALRDSFEPLMDALRNALRHVFDQLAVPVPLEDAGYSVSVGIVNDRSLFRDAVFVLGARADVSPAEMQRQFPALVKVAPSDQIGELIHLALPGISLHPLASPPREMNTLAGFTYFRFDQSNPLWQHLATGGLALHVGDGFPGLQLECWAIRQPRPGGDR